LLRLKFAKDTSRDFDYAILELATLAKPTDTCQKHLVSKLSLALLG